MEPLVRRKRGDSVGLTKRGKGNKIMAICDANGLLIAMAVTSANPHESTLVDTTIDGKTLNELPQIIVGDKAYDSDKVDAHIKAKYGIRLVAPNRRNRVQGHQDGRFLRRYKRRWHIERCFAWLQNYRRVVVRWERKVANWISCIWLAAGNLLANRVMR